VIRPPRLRTGDRVALVAPASPFKRDDLEAGLTELRALGFEPVFDDAIFLRKRFVAGPAPVRAASLSAAYADPSVRAVIAVRGGYGSVEVLPLLDGGMLRRSPKLLVGYSDITALLNWSLAHGVVAIHGPMVEGRIAKGEVGYDRRTFLDTLTQPAPMGPLQPPGLEVLQHGEAEGPLVGGTVTQLAALLGTPWPPVVPVGSIVFLEDVNERPYRVHRALTQLTQAGVLRHTSAIVLGEFPRCDEPGGDPAIRDVLREFFADFQGPVLFGFPSGHTAGAAWTLPFGVHARVATTPVPVLDVLEAAVE
jgi:muramoyltetrapeptide carboxypeptidase